MTTATFDLKPEYLRAGAAIGKAIRPLAEAGLVLHEVPELPKHFVEQFISVHESVTRLIDDLYRAAGMPVPVREGE